MINRLLTSLLLVGGLVLGGCASAPQMPVALNAGTTLKPETRIGVAMTAVPKSDTYWPGADCLLCYAAASVANSSLTAHAKTLPVDDLAALKTQMAAALKKKGVQVVVIDEDLEVDKFPKLSKDLNFAKRDFSSLRDRYKIDKLLLVEISGVGFQRNYASYIPTSDARAWINGTGSVIDLGTHAYDWWQPLETLRPAQGKWDEPPKFPGLTSAYYEALELAKDKVLAPLAQ